MSLMPHVSTICSTVESDMSRLSKAKITTTASVLYRFFDLCVCEGKIFFLEGAEYAKHPNHFSQFLEKCAPISSASPNVPTAAKINFHYAIIF